MNFRPLQLATICASIILPHFSFAQGSENRVNLDVHSTQYQITSIIYSSSAGRAIVGILDKSNRRIGTFVECEAPVGPVTSAINKSDLRNCVSEKGMWFELTDRNVEAVDRNFTINLQRNLESAFRDDMRSASGGNLIVFGIGTLVSSAVTIALGSETLAMLKAGQRLKALGRAGGTIFAGVMAAAMGVIAYSSDYNMNYRPAPSLESAMLESYQKLLTEKPEVRLIEFKPSTWLISFEMVKKSLYQAISRLNEA